MVKLERSVIAARRECELCADMAHLLRTPAPGVAGAGLGALANSHLRRQIGQVCLLCNQVLMHMMWK